MPHRLRIRASWTVPIALTLLPFAKAPSQWPIVATLAILLLRRDIAATLRRVTSLKVGSFEASLDAPREPLPEGAGGDEDPGHPEGTYAGRVAGCKDRPAPGNPGDSSGASQEKRGQPDPDRRAPKASRRACIDSRRTHPSPSSSQGSRGVTAEKTRERYTSYRTGGT